MDSTTDGSSCRLVVTELSHIKQLVTQLDVHLGDSPDLCKRLASHIFSLTERSIGIITSASGFDNGGRKRSAADAGLVVSATPSPLSDVVYAPFIKTNKKRKTTMEKRTLQVRVSSGGETPTAPVDDGHSWRKYGQKEILGAKHPRGYYRCTHRHSQGCAATKQVQRTDEDPALFDVVYLGTHTCCVHKTAISTAGEATKQQPAAPERNPDAHSLLQSLSASLTVNTEGLAAAAEGQGWSSAGATTPFCFSSAPASAAGLSPFSAPSTASENWGVSPATSDSNHVVSPFPPSSFDLRAQSELQEVVSALVAAGAPAAPAVDEFPDFDFDIASFLV